MTGACAGDGSGAGLRLSKTGICGAGFPRRVVGLRVKPLRPDKPAPCAKPPRARPEVDAPTTQANANTAAKRRFITYSFLSCAAPIGPHLIIQQKATSSLLPGLNPSCGVPSDYGNGRQGLARTSKRCSSALISLALQARTQRCCKHAPKGNGCENVCDLAVEFAGLIAAGLFCQCKIGRTYDDSPCGSYNGGGSLGVLACLCTIGREEHLPGPATWHYVSAFDRRRAFYGWGAPCDRNTSGRRNGNVDLLLNGRDRVKEYIRCYVRL